jgi:hypothetical protein
MNAILSVAAGHLRHLCPNEPRYARACMMFLSKSCAEFRAELGQESASNYDALLGTSILIHYLTWCNLEFLDGATPETLLDSPINFSKDQLFLLSPGVRQIVFMSWPILHVKECIFNKAKMSRSCNPFSLVIQHRADDHLDVSKRLMSLYDNPLFKGCKRRASSPSKSDSAAVNGPGDSGPSLLTTPEPLAEERLMLDLARFRRYTSETTNGTMDAYMLSNLMVKDRACADYKSRTDIEAEILARASFERVTNRLATIIIYLSELNRRKKETSADLDPIEFPHRSDVERYFLAFPLLCHGAFLTMALEGDTRTLAIFYHFYRIARMLLGSTRTWWISQRAATMETMIMEELKLRGLWEQVRHRLLGIYTRDHYEYDGEEF